MQHPIEPAIDFNSIRDAIESMLVGRDQLVDDRDMQNILIAILEYSRQQRAVCQNPYINNATNTWYVYDSNGNPYDTNVSAEGTIIKQTEAESIEGDPMVTLTQIDPIKPNEMKMTMYIPKGQDGEDGFSPIVEVIQGDNSATINITDKEGQHTATISGLDGSYVPLYSTEKDWENRANWGNHYRVLMYGKQGYIECYSTGIVPIYMCPKYQPLKLSTYTGNLNGQCFDTSGGLANVTLLCSTYLHDTGSYYNIQPIEILDSTIIDYYSYIIYNGANRKPNTVFTGVENVIDFTSINGAKVYAYPLTEPPVEIGSGYIQSGGTYIVKEGESYITYNGANRNPDTVFTGVENVIDFTSINGAKVYAYPLTEPPVEIMPGGIQNGGEYIVKACDAYITLSNYIDAYNKADITRVIKKIQYLPSLNEDKDISNFKVKVNHPYTYPEIDRTTTHANGQLVSTNYSIDQMGNLDNESYGHLFPLRANKTYKIRVYLNKTYEKIYKEENPEIVSGGIQGDAYYTVIGESGSYITYNESNHSPEDIFRGVKGVAIFTSTNGAKVYRTYLNPLIEPIEIASGDIQKDVYYTVKGSYITYGGSEYTQNAVFTGVSGIPYFTSTNNAKVYAYPLAEPPIEIGSGYIQSGETYIVKEGESYITYNGLPYKSWDIFKGVENFSTFTSTNEAKVYTSVQPNGNASVYTEKPWKYEDMSLIFYTDDKAKISNNCYNYAGNMARYDDTSDNNAWSYGEFKMFSINGDLFFAVDMRDVIEENSAHSEDIYGNWDNVDNINYGDTTKDILNCTLLLDVVENDLTQVTTNNESPAIEQS